MQVVVDEKVQAPALARRDNLSDDSKGTLCGRFREFDQLEREGPRLVRARERSFLDALEERLEGRLLCGRMEN